MWWVGTDGPAGELLQNMIISTEGMYYEVSDGRENGFHFLPGRAPCPVFVPSGAG